MAGGPCFFVYVTPRGNVILKANKKTQTMPRCWHQWLQRFYLLPVGNCRPGVGMLWGLVADEMRQRDKKWNIQDVCNFSFLLAFCTHWTASSTTLFFHFLGVSSNISFQTPRQEPPLQTSDSWSALTGEGNLPLLLLLTPPRGTRPPGCSPYGGLSLAAATSRGTHAPSSHYIPNLPFWRPSLGGPHPFISLITQQRGAFAPIGVNRKHGKFWVFPTHATQAWCVFALLQVWWLVDNYYLYCCCTAASELSIAFVQRSPAQMILQHNYNDLFHFALYTNATVIFPKSASE